MGQPNDVGHVVLHVAIGAELEVRSRGFAHHGESLHDAVDLGEGQTAVPNIGVSVGRHEIDVELQLGKSFVAARCGHLFPGVEIGDVGWGAAIEVDFNLIAKASAKQVVGGRAERLTDQIAERDFDATHRPNWRSPWCRGGRAKWDGVHPGFHLIRPRGRGVRRSGAVERFGDDGIDGKNVPSGEVGIKVFDAFANAHEVITFAESELTVVGVDANDDFGNFGVTFATDAVFTGTAETHHTDGGNFHRKGNTAQS